MHHQKIKACVVGTGNVATRNYLPALAERDDVQIACFNRTQPKGARAAESFGAVHLPQLEDVANWQPDVAFVLVSEQARFDLACRLLEMGVPRLFLEKPMVARHGQAHVDEQDFHKGLELMRLARAASCQVAMVFNYRFFEQSLAARSIAVERDFGEAVGFCGMVHYACWSHCIDLVHHFAGLPEVITALKGPIDRDGQGITAADLGVSMTLQNGAVGTLIGTAAMSWQHPLFELVLNFERGRLHLRDLEGSLEVLGRENNLHEIRTFSRHESRWEQYGGSFARSIHAYLDSLRDGTEPPVPGLAGLHELQTEAAIRRSASEARPVRVQTEFPISLHAESDEQ